MAQKHYSIYLFVIESGPSTEPDVQRRWPRASADFRSVGLVLCTARFVAITLRSNRWVCPHLCLWTQQEPRASIAAIPGWVDGPSLITNIEAV